MKNDSKRLKYHRERMAEYRAKNKPAQPRTRKNGWVLILGKRIRWQSLGGI